MAKIKYSAIVGSLGQNCDRFLREGYKYPEEIKGSFQEEVDALAGLGVLDALDLYYAEEGINSDAAATTDPPGHTQKENTDRPEGRWHASL